MNRDYIRSIDCWTRRCSDGRHSQAQVKHCAGDPRPADHPVMPLSMRSGHRPAGRSDLIHGIAPSIGKDPRYRQFRHDIASLRKVPRRYVNERMIPIIYCYSHKNFGGWALRSRTHARHWHRCWWFPENCSRRQSFRWSPTRGDCLIRRLMCKSFYYR